MVNGSAVHWVAAAAAQGQYVYHSTQSNSTHVIGVGPQLNRAHTTDNGVLLHSILPASYAATAAPEFKITGLDVHGTALAFSFTEARCPVVHNVICWVGCRLWCRMQPNPTAARWPPSCYR